MRRYSLSETWHNESRTARRTTRWLQPGHQILAGVEYWNQEVKLESQTRRDITIIVITDCKRGRRVRRGRETRWQIQRGIEESKKTTEDIRFTTYSKVLAARARKKTDQDGDNCSATQAVTREPPLNRIFTTSVDIDRRHRVKKEIYGFRQLESRQSPQVFQSTIVDGQGPSITRELFTPIATSLLCWRTVSETSETNIIQMSHRLPERDWWFQDQS